MVVHSYSCAHLNLPAFECLYAWICAQVCARIYVCACAQACARMSVCLGLRSSLRECVCASICAQVCAQVVVCMGLRASLRECVCACVRASLCAMSVCVCMRASLRAYGFMHESAHKCARKCLCVWLCVHCATTKKWSHMFLYNSITISYIIYKLEDMFNFLLITNNTILLTELSFFLRSITKYIQIFMWIVSSATWNWDKF